MGSLFTFILFAIAVTGSPGPNNLLLMHSGLRFGIRRTFPYFLGSFIGSICIYSLISFGFSYIFLKYPQIKFLIKLFGSMYMLYLALKIAQMNETEVKENKDKPFTVMQGIGLQLLNPKLWIVALTMNSMFHQSTNIIINSLYFVFVLSSITIFRMFLWIILGKMIQKVIKSSLHRNILNLTLGLFLAITVLFLWV
jgi:threonine/homoserine/homoserine lactone efflux protein